MAIAIRTLLVHGRLPLLEHLRGAFNGGRILPTMSVFGPGVRVHNDQLIRYAGGLRDADTVVVVALRVTTALY